MAFIASHSKSCTRLHRRGTLIRRNSIRTREKLSQDSGTQANSSLYTVVRC